MTMKNTRKNFIFGPVGRFFGSAASSLIVARQANALVNAPDSVFRARGTTRDQALRDLMNSL
ncbi:MAG: hypothetical protein ACR2O0_15765 [Rhizobiaceae bacterium]